MQPLLVGEEYEFMSLSGRDMAGYAATRHQG